MHFLRSGGYRIREGRFKDCSDQGRQLTRYLPATETLALFDRLELGFIEEYHAFVSTSEGEYGTIIHQHASERFCVGRKRSRG